MFGQNKPTSKHYFSDLPENSLGIVSRFYTLQGEGPYSGMPALFIRLSKCNLTCGFCDTYFNDMIIYSFDELYDDGINCIINWREKNNPIDNKNIRIDNNEIYSEKRYSEMLGFSSSIFKYLYLGGNLEDFNKPPTYL